MEILLLSFSLAVAGGLVCWRIAQELPEDGDSSHALNSDARRRCKKFIYKEGAVSASSPGHDAAVAADRAAFLARLPSIRKPGHPLTASQPAPPVQGALPPPPLPRPASLRRWRECCSICLEDFAVGETLCLLPCGYGHVFHSDCCVQWFKRRGSCPVCQTDLNSVAAGSDKQRRGNIHWPWTRFVHEHHEGGGPHPLSRTRIVAATAW